MQPTDLSTELHARLQDAGSSGLTKTKLLKGGKKAEQALALLISRREVANLGTDRKTRYVLQEHFRPLDLACAAVLGKATPGKATTHLLSDLRKGTAGIVADKIEEAVKRLLHERKLIQIKRGKRGKSVFYLHAASIEPLVDFRVGAGAAPPVPPAAFDPAQVRLAYAALVRETGFPDVRVSDLQNRSGTVLNELQHWLLEQSRAGTVSPTRGEWSLAGEAERAAALDIGGEPHLRVRLL